jgi:hypothetical protein
MRFGMYRGVRFTFSRSLSGVLSCAALSLSNVSKYDLPPHLDTFSSRSSIHSETHLNLLVFCLLFILRFGTLGDRLGTR